MYHPTTRVLAVLELLQSHPRMSGPELARRLEVDARTVRRYVTMLQDLGIPVEAERGRHGAYRLRPGFKLPPLMFSDDEALAVVLGLLAARDLGLAASTPAVDGALAKVERVLPAALRERVGTVPLALTMDLGRRAAAPESAVLLALSAATRTLRRVRIRYGDRAGEVTERETDPYGVVHVSGRWFAPAYCHLRRDVRVFRLDRVQTVEVLETPFVRPAGFDAVAAVQASLAMTPGTWTVEATLRATLAEARDALPPELAVLEEEEGGVRLRCVVQHLAWIAAVLVGTGFPFRVVGPPELRDELRRLAARLNEWMDDGDAETGDGSRIDPRLSARRSGDGAGAGADRAG